MREVVGPTRRGGGGERLGNFVYNEMEGVFQQLFDLYVSFGGLDRGGWNEIS